MNQPHIEYTTETKTLVKAHAEWDGRTVVACGDSREDAFYALRNVVVQLLLRRGLHYAADEVGRTWEYTEEA